MLCGISVAIKGNLQMLSPSMCGAGNDQLCSNITFIPNNQRSIKLTFKLEIPYSEPRIYLFKDKQIHLKI